VERKNTFAQALCMGRSHQQLYEFKEGHFSASNLMEQSLKCEKVILAAPIIGNASSTRKENFLESLIRFVSY
jgi:hypothetical protein